MWGKAVKKEKEEELVKVYVNRNMRKIKNFST